MSWILVAEVAGFPKLEFWVCKLGEVGRRYEVLKENEGGPASACRATSGGCEDVPSRVEIRQQLKIQAASSSEAVGCWVLRLAAFCGTYSSPTPRVLKGNFAPAS